MFSFCLYDIKEKKVFLCRDSVGKKPLFYYYNGNESIIFSSNIGAIIDNLSSKTEINQNSLSYYWEKGFIDPRTSFYENIYPLLPGELLVFDLNKRSLEKTRLNPTYIDYTKFDYTDENIEKEFNILFHESIEKRLKGIKTLTIGTLAPDFIINTSSNLTGFENPLSFKTGTTFHQYKTNSRYKLLLFWSADCGHCKDLVCSNSLPLNLLLKSVLYLRV